MLHQLPLPCIWLGFKVPLLELCCWGNASQCGDMWSWLALALSVPPHFRGQPTSPLRTESHCPCQEPPRVADAGRLCLFPQHSRETAALPPGDCALGPATVPGGGGHRQVLSYRTALQGGIHFLQLRTEPQTHNRTQAWLPSSSPKKALQLEMGSLSVSV